MATWTQPTKSTASWTAGSKSASEVIYMVSEALDFYLIGTSENETLVAQDSINWLSDNKN